MCFTTLISKAQPYFDVATIQTSTANHFISNSTSDSSIKVNWFLANLNLPIELNKKNLLLATLGYEDYSFENESPLLTQNFNSIYIPLTLLHTWKDTSWTTSFTYIPRVNSAAPIHVGDHTFQHGGAIIVSHSVNPHFKYSVGAYYNREFFGNYFLPLLGIEWKASKRLNIFGLLPNDMTADYKINKALHTGFIYKGLTTSFRYKPASTADYLSIPSEGQLNLFADLYITKTIVLNLQGGVIVARVYNLQYKSQYEPANYKSEFDVKESSVFKIGLFYRVWL